MTISSIIIFLAILFLLVVVHELGHFLTAKYFKMRVDEFAFGFPPSIFQKKYKETVYSFNLIPLGGYVKIFGENGLTSEELENLSDQERKQLFGSKPWWQRIIVLSAGVVFNIVGAFILFTFVFLLGSNVYLDRDEVSAIPAADRHLLLIDIKESSPLLNTGINIGDEIVKVQANAVTLENESLDSFTAAQFVQDNQNSIITISYLNKEKVLSEIQVVPKAGIVEGKKVLGANFANSTFKQFSFFEALPHAVETTYYQLKYIFVGLGSLVYNLIFKDAKVEDNLSGPIGLAVITSKVSEQGLSQILAFAAMLSLSLAVFNILPIPALDGGRIVFVLLEVISQRKLKATTEQLFHGLGFLALLILMVFVTYFDIVRAFV